MVEARLETDAPDPDQWMTTGRTYDEQRFSPLATIDATNVGRLGLVASTDVPTQMGQEATPLVVDGVIYVATDWSIVKAIDATTGRELWSYDPGVRTSMVNACCGPVNRGVAAWRGRIYVGALDGRLIALDARTGALRWQVRTTDASRPYTITGAPRIIRGKVIIGNGGADLGVRGYVSAYDAETGALAWRFYTVPGDPARRDGAASDDALAAHARNTWFGDRYWRLGGGGTVWDAMAYDPKLDLLYIGTGNGGPYNQAIRSAGRGDNLFLSSIVALRPETGEYVWHYQTTPGDSWDFTATQHIVLADLAIGGRVRQVLMQAPKNGFFYVLDRKTGELLSAKPFVPMTWATGVDLKTGRPVEVPGARYWATGKPFLTAPSGLGAHNWQPMSFSPKTGLVYIPVQQLPVTYVDAKQQAIGPQKLNLGADYALVTPPAGLEPKGWLAAWDPIAGKERWRVPHPVPVNGGVLSTAGGLVFQGDAQGQFAAYAAASGKRLWSFDAQTGIVAAPISYAIGGVQYVAVMAGWGGSLAMVGGARAGAIGPNRLLIFRLGGAAKLPPAPAVSLPPLDPPAATQPGAQVASGEHDYFAYCSRCHGVNAISGGVVPDLRHSGLLGNDGWYEVLLKGALTENGMASFAPVLSRDRVTAIRAYVIAQAQLAKRDETAPVKPRPASTGVGL
ncbi:PQQ-dependent dehydrogenase, methanol/ethanol family [Sphingomonas profundi]|uniref:PQQ-dependent dehydrogenase, methanol/ethanol family n=1 Tax=Alterirhizorhabdus profundi TaxID=2681549 RepID=UPI001E3F4358|nr:PQQ-dependent dehydrogenase, methanol/ethanol family [Sphingomonas profundi]